MTREWQPGELPPEGYKVSHYYHCGSCQGHEHLEAVESTHQLAFKQPSLFSNYRPEARRRYQVRWKDA